MHEEFDEIKLKMKALGFSQQQIEATINKTLAGRNWDKISASEKQQILQSIDERIVFLRKFLRNISCKYCSQTNSTAKE